jgi:hypothetical protein
MNKKILFSILSAILALPVTVLGVTGDASTGTTVDSIADKVRTTLTTVAGSIVFIGWIVAGILWLLSGGSPEKTGTAKKAIIACTIGTVLVILAGASGPITDVIKNAFGLS